MKKIIKCHTAPQAIGPYSQAIINDNLIFLSGQIPLTPQGELITGTIQEQTTQIMTNIQNILSSIGLGLSDILKTTVFLTDLNDFNAFNQTYGSFFPESFPARTTVQVSALPKGAKIEIEVLAALSAKA